MLGAAELFEAMESVPRNYDSTGSSSSRTPRRRNFGTSVKFSPLNVSVERFSLILEAAEDQVEVSSFKEEEKVSHAYSCRLKM